MSKLTKVHTLAMSSNKITSLHPLQGLVSLQRLILRNNKVDNLPWIFSPMTSLSVLDVSSNEITTVAPYLGNIISLKSLNLSENKISKIPESLSNLKFSREIILSRNPIIELPESLLKLRRTPMTPVMVLSSLPDEILPNLYLGNLEAAQFLPALIHRKITHIVRVLEAGAPEFPKNFFYHVVPVQDSPSYNLFPYLEDTIRFIDTGRSTGAVLVHWYVIMI